METNAITFCRAEAAATAPVADMPADLYYALTRRAPEAMTILCDGRPVGAAMLDSGSTAFLIVYILPAYRRRGLGTAAARLLEARAPAAKRFMTAYHDSDAGAAAFLRRLGYGRQFSSACMTYAGQPFPPQTLCVRPYRDADYDAAHLLYAEAFHRMRVAVGDFPNSVPEPASPQMRSAWAETADERLVCEYDGVVAGYAHVEGEELASIAVAPDVQGRGIGTAFVQAVCSRILSEHDQVVLYCVTGNTARRLYDRLGFTERCVDAYAVKPAGC